MKTIWKYPIESFNQEIQMPLDTEILCVQLQNNIPTLWALVETENVKKSLARFDILTYYTGDHQINEKAKYIGTYQLAGLVYHVFVKQQNENAF